MTDPTNDNLNRTTPEDGSIGPPTGAPELEGLLKDWHAQNAARAAAGRDRLMASLRAGSTASAPSGSTLNLPSLLEEIEGESKSEQSTKHAKQHTGGTRRNSNGRGVLGRIFMHRYSPLAAATLALASVMVYFVSTNPQGNPAFTSSTGGTLLNPVDSSENLTLIRKACDDRYVMAPDGGRLDAIDRFGNILGPCILKHTDVDVQISGFLSRVNVKQIYVNPHSAKVETVYTFPLSERSAVDRMTMTIGSRVIEGQVKERAEAQRIYQEAKAQGRVASLLEQERPNIFTQSIANIEPQAEIAIEISYVEVMTPRNGEFSFAFPTTIAPRYIPGEMRTWEVIPPPRPPVRVDLPPGFAPRPGIVLLGPPRRVELQPGDLSKATLSSDDLSQELRRARAVRPTQSMGGTVWYNFTVQYDDGSKELGTLYTNGAGHVNNRWFYSAELESRNAVRPFTPIGDVPSDPLEIKRRYPSTGLNIPPWGGGGGDSGVGGAANRPGESFAPTTTNVPDANRITPMPVRPDQRAGHDISITVTIDTGGPGLSNIKSALHEIRITDDPSAVPMSRATGHGGIDAPTFPGVARKTIKLANQGEIPNRDFSLSWKTVGGLEQPIVLTHTTPQLGNFFFVSVLPPSKADDAIAVPREIMFVLDRSGSMKGFKLEQAKALIDATLATMRPSDTFNVLCFSNEFETLWATPQRATPENIAQARAFYGRNEGSGGTEMLKVVSTALSPSGSTVNVAPPPVRINVIAPEDLVRLAADGRDVVVDVPSDRLTQIEDQGNDRLPNRAIKMPNDGDIKVRIRNRLFAIKAPAIRLAGTWVTENGERVLSVTQVDASSGDGERPNWNPAAPAKPLRLVAFITDGEIGNDMEVLDAIRRHRGDARVFSFAIGDSPNRYLLDGMARLGRGEVDYVPLNSDPKQIIERFTQRVTTPVLTDIKAQFSPNLQTSVLPMDVYTALGGGGGAGERVSDFEFIPDLYDQKPVIIVGRYANNTTPVSGTLTLSGNAAGGAWSKTVNVTLPASDPRNSAIATVWARTKVESIIDANLTSVQRGNLAADQRGQIIALGESFNLVTQFTSFVAVDRLRVTVGGITRLVQIPIEFEHGAEWAGYFYGPSRDNRAMRENAQRANDGEFAKDQRAYDPALLEYPTAFPDAVNPKGFAPAGVMQNSLGLLADLQLGAGDSADGIDLANVDFSMIAQIDLQSLLQSSQGGGSGGSSPFRDDAYNLYQEHLRLRVDPNATSRAYTVLHVAPPTTTTESLGAFRLNYPAATPDQYGVTPQTPALSRPADAAGHARLSTGAPAAPSTALEPGFQTRRTKSDAERARELAQTTTRSGAVEPAKPSEPAPSGSAPAERAPAVRRDEASTRMEDHIQRGSTSSGTAGKPAGEKRPADPVSTAPGAAPTPSPSLTSPSSTPAATPATPGGNPPARDELAELKKEAGNESARKSGRGAELPSQPEAEKDKAVATDAKLDAAENGPAPALEGAPASDSINPVITLAAMVEATQLAPKPEDRLGRLVRTDANEQRLIEMYVSEVETAAREIRAAQEAIARYKLAETAGVERGEDSSAKTSHDASKSAAAESPKVGSPSEPSPIVRPVRREEIAMHIASLAKRNKIDDAKKWSLVYHGAFKDYDIAAKMHDILADETMKDEAKTFLLVELGDRAATELATIVRESKIRRRVEQTLVPFALGSGYPVKLGIVYDGVVPAGGTMVDSGLLVSIIVSTMNDETIKAMRDAGVRVESSDNDTRVVVGVVPLGRLADVALTPGVRWVEMTKE